MIDVVRPHDVLAHRMPQTEFLRGRYMTAACGESAATWLVAVPARLPVCPACAVVERRWLEMRGFADEIAQDEFEYDRRARWSE